MSVETMLQAVLDGQDRIDTRMSRVEDAVITLARVEERQSQQITRLDAVDRRVAAIEDEHEDRIAQLEGIERLNAVARADVDGLGQRIGGVESKIAKWAGALGVLVPLATVAGQWLMERMAH